MPLIIASFDKIKFVAKLLGFRPRFYSVARWQPRGFRLPELPFLAPPPGLEVDMARTDSLTFYEAELRSAYTERWPEIKSWLDGLDNTEVIGIACWCPYKKGNAFWKPGKPFACHTGLIGRMVNRHRPDIEIWLDHTHSKLIPEWRPKYSRLLGFRGKQKLLFSSMEVKHAGQAI